MFIAGTNILQSIDLYFSQPFLNIQISEIFHKVVKQENTLADIFGDFFSKM